MRVIIPKFILAVFHPMGTRLLNRLFIHPPRIVIYHTKLIIARISSAAVVVNSGGVFVLYHAINSRFALVIEGYFVSICF